MQLFSIRELAYPPRQRFLIDIDMECNSNLMMNVFAFQASKKQKLFLMLWCPDTAKVKKKMLYSSSFDALKKSLVGVQKYIQVQYLSHNNTFSSVLQKLILNVLFF